MTRSNARLEKQIISLARRGSPEQCGPLLLLRCAAILFVSEGGDILDQNEIDYLKASFEMQVELGRLRRMGDTNAISAFIEESDTSLAALVRKTEEQ